MGGLETYDISVAANEPRLGEAAKSQPLDGAVRGLWISAHHVYDALVEAKLLDVISIVTPHAMTTKRYASQRRPQ